MNEELFDKLVELQNDPSNRLAGKHVDLVRRKIEQPSRPIAPAPTPAPAPAPAPIQEGASPAEPVSASGVWGFYVLSVALVVLLDNLSRFLV